jgi:hypothetical protein|tara:strand:- start:586 stop:1485 length:900 start_codon:yes stop_codon:yes gene_type:complete
MATGLTLSSSSSLSDISNIVIASAISNIEPAGPTNQLVSRYDIPQGAKQVNIPIWGRNDAAALTEGVDITAPQQLSVTVTSITASEHGIMTFVSDRLSRQNNEDILSHVGEVQGGALGRLLEDDLTSLFDGFSNSIGSAGSYLTYYHVAGAVSYLKTDNNSSFGMAPGTPNGVFHPEQIRAFVQEVTGIQGGGTTGMAAQPIPEGITSEVIQNYFRGNERIFGIPIYQSGVLGRDGSGDVKGAVFVPQAIALAMAHEMEAEEERDASLRGTEMVMVGEWGEAEIADPWGVEMLGAADAI